MTSRPVAIELRRQAEALARVETASVRPPALSPEAMQKMLHELRVHQIELEMQNEELRRAQAALGAAQARYFDLYDLAPVGYCTLCEQGVVQDANLTAATLLGVPRAALIKQPLTRFVAATDQDSYYLFRKRLTASATGQACELWMVKQDGTQFWAHLEATPAQAADGSVELRVMLIDASERKRSDAELVAARRVAEKADNAKSRFLAAASHDLRQPLAALSIYSDLLKSEVTAAGQPLVANLRGCVDSLSNLLNNLLDLSKLEAGVVAPHPSDFSLAAVLASIVSVHTPEAQLKGLRLRCVPTRLTARTDPVLFKRILDNLVDNALRYTERGGVRVGCRRRQGTTWVEVWDSGIGIAADKTTDIFEEFKQLGDEGRTRGSGLGLAIVAKTAALLRLEIRVRSWPGRGSVFAIELPLGQAQGIPVLEAGETVYRALRIALVEDNAQVREAVARWLAGMGHQVIVAGTGDELQARLGGIPPDIVISDYRLAHGKTGFDVVTALRSSMAADLPAILITGDTDPNLLRSMADRGIVILHKPLDLETLQAYLEELTYPD